MTSLPTPTPEQSAAIDLACTGSHLMLKARAGAAKTTTLEMIANSPFMKKRSVLSLAFNKKIAEEMTLRLPSTVTCKTLHSLGSQLWWEYIRKRTKVDKGKTYRLVTAQLQTIEDPIERETFYEDLQLLLDAVRSTKAVGYVHGVESRSNVRLLCDAETFFTGYDTDLSLEYQALVKLVTKQSFDEMMQGVIDFDDMLLGPAICRISYPDYDTVMVDETQDLSPINHEMVRKLVKRKTQLICVGDPCQAIYGFRGASEESMDELQAMFDMPELYLTTSFRCSRAVIQEALWRAADMIAPDWALGGAVRHRDTWSASDIPDGAAIICRTNAPLFSTALRLLRDGRYPDLSGRDIIKGLLTTMKKFGKPGTTIDQAHGALDKWLEKELARARDKRKINDRADCIRIFLDQATTLGEAMDVARALQTQSGRIKLMTGHKAKGLEFTEVFFLDQHLCRVDRGQDANIKYVIQTRAKDTLNYITSEGYRR